MKLPGKLDKHAIAESVCSTDPFHPTLLDPYLIGTNLYATDSYVAVRLPIGREANDTDGYVPVLALQLARKARPLPAALALDSEVARVEIAEVLTTIQRRQGAFSKTLPGMIDGLSGEMTIALDAAKLMAVCKALGTTSVKLTVTGMTKPVLVEPALSSADDRRGVVMPLYLPAYRKAAS